jgi:hypothetical protein
MIYDGQMNSPGVPGNGLGLASANTGGIPNQPLDPRFKNKLQQPGTPPPPGFREQYGLPPASGNVPQAFGMPQPGSMVAGSPGYMLDRDIIEQRMDNNDIKQRGIENFRYKGAPGTQTPTPTPLSGPQLFPLAQSSPGTVPMGNAGAIANEEFYKGPQYGQAPGGWGKTVS